MTLSLSQSCLPSRDLQHCTTTTLDYYKATTTLWCRQSFSSCKLWQLYVLPRFPWPLRDLFEERSALFSFKAYMKICPRKWCLRLETAWYIIISQCIEYSTFVEVTAVSSALLLYNNPRSLRSSYCKVCDPESHHQDINCGHAVLHLKMCSKMLDLF